MITPVAIALVSHNGSFLVGRRGPDGALAGYCEFPGGKCQPGESTAECAVRECREETGLAIEVLRLRRELEHTYPYGTVHLHVFDCRMVSSSENCPLPPRFTWVPLDGLADLRFPEPNGPLIAELMAEARCQPAK